MFSNLLIFVFLVSINIFYVLLFFFCFPLCITTRTDDLSLEKEKNKMLQEEMEATLNDIQNM